MGDSTNLSCTLTKLQKKCNLAKGDPSIIESAIRYIKIEFHSQVKTKDKILSKTKKDYGER
jgi:hypothetical protein